MSSPYHANLQEKIRAEEGRQATNEPVELSEHLQNRPQPVPVDPEHEFPRAEPVQHMRQSRRQYLDGGRDENTHWDHNLWRSSNKDHRLMRD